MPWPFPTASTTAVGLNAPRLVLVTAPAEEPVTSAEAKLWLKVDLDDDDAIISSLITAARRVFEELTGRSLVNTTWRAEWDALPRGGTYIGAPTIRELELPKAPLVSVTSVKYKDDTDGTLTTFDAANYTVGTDLDSGRYGRLWLNDDSDWPDLGSYPGALQCTFVAGTGADATTVPEEIKVCLKLLLTHLYSNRAPVNIGNIVNEIPYTLKFLLERFTIRSLV